MDGDAPATFAHELGHNLYLNHDRYADCRGSEGRAYCRDWSERPYGYGYVNQRMFQPGAPTISRWWTIMAYSAQCEDFAEGEGKADRIAWCWWSGGGPVLQFSNPTAGSGAIVRVCPGLDARRPLTARRTRGAP